jgi:hypothetical protein
MPIAATEVAGPGGAISLSLTDASKMPGGVPEPSTWAMMLLGFAGLGYAGFRRSYRLIPSSRERASQPRLRKRGWSGPREPAVAIALGLVITEL